VEREQEGRWGEGGKREGRKRGEEGHVRKPR